MYHLIKGFKESDIIRYNTMGYEDGKIYAIRSHQTDDIYIGSTCSPLYKRLYDHKRKYKKNVGYYSSYELLKYDDVYIELLEEYPCKNRMELGKREGHYIREMNCVNKRIEGRTMKEYIEENKDKLKQQQKEWKTNNRDKLLEGKKRYYEKTKHLLDKDKQKEIRQRYYEKNKDRLLERHECECGGMYQNRDKLKHQKTKKHRNYIISLNKNEE